MRFVLCAPLLLLLVPAPPDPEPDPRAKGFLGVQLTENAGVTVSKVIPNSPAEKGGLRVGDAVLKIDGTEVRALAEAVSLIQHARPGNTLEIELRRGGSTMTVKVKVGARPSDLP